MASEQPRGSRFSAIDLLFTVVIVSALYLGREILVPIALALLMSFVLSPFVRILQGWRFPRVFAVIEIS